VFTPLISSWKRAFALYHKVIPAITGLLILSITPCQAQGTRLRSRRHSRDGEGCAALALHCTLHSTLSSGPTQGTIKLEVSTIGPESVLNSLSHLQDGLTERGLYPDFPAAIGTNKEALIAAMADYDAGEIWLRSLRVALDLQTNNGRSTLRTAASTCESLDRRDESLVGVGWELRRPPGRPRPVVAPTRFTVKNTGYEGEVETRWTRVSNAHFQEAKVFTSPTIDNPDLIPWDSLPVIASSQASLLIQAQPVGAWLTARVRAVGSKGPSPWSDPSAVRVN
jgi:hypothetical protein